ncbi:adhesion G-protein coupled receptor G4-like, partial [Saccostrea cucullata]|uniref:adhesion G-protein coupled receptor G4-like n=1 Tax=Saccostrea cuccullata TaxID=36930 RepID=UPI002ED1780C
IVVSQNWTDTSPLCIGTRDRLRELQVRSCYERLPFFCYKEADVLSFRLGLNICPSGWVGSADVKSCYLMMSADSAVSQPDAFQYCNQNGGQLLQLNFLTDGQLAVRILGHYRLINTSVWFEETAGTISCSSLYLDENMILTSSSNCKQTARFVCQTNRKDTKYSSEDVQIAFQKPKVLINQTLPYVGGEVSCTFPSPHLEFDNYTMYKGGYIVKQLNESESSYSVSIMNWNLEDNSDTSFLASAANDVDIYRCELQRKGSAYVVSKDVYAIPNDDRVSIFHASVRLYVPMNTSSALRATYNLGGSLQDALRRDIESRFYFIWASLFPSRDSALRLIRIKNVSLKSGKTANFLISFVTPSIGWKTAEGIGELLKNITREASTPIRESRRKRQQRYVDFGTLEIRSEEFCTLGYSPDFQSTFAFKAVGNGSTTYSEKLCITDSKPLLTGLCYTKTAVPAEIRQMTVNPNCRFLLDPAFSDMTPLKNLSEISANISNLENIALDVSNLTANSSALTVQDVVYTSIILQNVASIPTISQKIMNTVLNTFSNILEAPGDVLTAAHDKGSSTTRILESVETILRNVTLNGTIYRNFQRGYAVSVVDISADEPPVIGIQLEDTDENTALSNETVDLVTNQTDIAANITNTGIALPVAAIQGKTTRVVLSIYENTNLFQVKAANSRYQLNGKVASATLITNGQVVTDLGGRFVTSVYKPDNDTADSVCGFWNHSFYDTSGGWSTKGCQRIGEKNGRIVCQCDHLTNFAILLDVKGQSDVIDSGNTLALSVITVIGLSLSILGLGLTVLSFILFKTLRKGRGQQTLFNLALALLCSMIIFLVGMDRTESYYGCITVAALMHYFLLVSFMWMLVEGFLQYLRFVRVLGTYIPRFILKAAIPAWGLPLLPVIIVLAIDYDLYKGGNHYCWMSRSPFYFAFLIPVVLIILLNCIIFAVVLKNLLNRPKGLQSNQSESKMAMMNLRAAVSIFILLGLTWIFGILAIEDARVVFAYIFTILTTFQGFFIFILFVAREKQFRNLWKKICCQHCIENKQKKYKQTSSSEGTGHGQAPLKIRDANYNSQTESTDFSLT